MQPKRDNRQIIRKVHHDRLLHCLDKIEADPWSTDFLTPVPWQKLGLSTYPKIIKTPMDLNTVRNNLKMNKYRYFETIFKDIKLIWSNCK